MSSKPETKMPGYGPEDFDPPPERLEIEGREGVALKKLLIDDAQDYYGLIAYNPDHLRQKFEGGSDDTAEKYKSADEVALSIMYPKNPDRMRFGIWDGETMVGSINLTPVEEGVGEIGYLVGDEHTGHAYAARAVRELSEYAFTKLGYKDLFADVYVGNEASRKTLLNSGFAYETEYSRVRKGKQERLWRFRRLNT